MSALRLYQREETVHDDRKAPRRGEAVSNLDPWTVELGRNIARKRGDARLTQTDLAERASAICGETISRASLTQFERGVNALKARYLDAIARALGVEVSDLMPRSAPRSSVTLYAEGLSVEEIEAVERAAASLIDSFRAAKAAKVPRHTHTPDTLGPRNDDGKDET